MIAGVGRQPNSDKLNLEKVGVETDAKGIKVNEYLQTSNSKIYAMGDVLSKNQPHLTPVSSFEGAYLGENLVKDEPQKLLIQQFLQSFLERQNWLRLAICQVKGFILRL
ncbi:FAD-dependent oxidoreductase [Lactococcus lactis]|nr:FAD-dependent oxidoreductase [Lactococcus lactis]